jgi:hypothetical protein
LIFEYLSILAERFYLAPVHPSNFSNSNLHVHSSNFTYLKSNSSGNHEVHTSSNRMTLLVASSLHRMSFQVAVAVACRRPLPLSFVERSSNGPVEHQAAAKAKRWSEPVLRGKQGEGRVMGAE